MGLAKKFLQFLNKNKIHFSLSPRTLLNNVFSVLFHYLLPFFRQLHNSIFPKLFIFLSKELLQVPFTVFQGIEAFFPLREFCKDWNQWKSEGTMSGEYEGWIRTSQPSCKFLPVHQRNKQSCVEDDAFSVDWFPMLSVKCCFQLIYWEQHLELIVWFGFPEGAHK